MKITKQQLRRIIKEAVVDSRTAVADHQAWEDYERGYQDALDNRGYGDNDSEEYMDGYEDGLLDLRSKPVSGRGMRQR